MKTMEVKMIELIKNQKFTMLLMVLLLVSCMGEYAGNKGRPIDDDSASTVAEPVPTNTAEVEISRPNQQVFLERNFCACQSGKAVLFSSDSNCVSFCSGRGDEQPTIYINTTLGAEIEANTLFGTLNNWCTVALPENETLGNPQCVLRAVYGTEVQDITINPIPSSNLITANITALNPGRPYVVSLVETSSGSHSDYIHVNVLQNAEDPVNSAGPLAIDPVHLYTCVERDASNTVYYNQSFKTHFNYISSNMPPSLMPGNKYVFCHDIQTYGEDDNPDYPRLELREGFFNVWSQQDLRMYDLDNNKQPDINKILADRFVAEGISGAPTELFVKWEWFLYPENGLQLENDGPIAGAPNYWSKLGFIMSPWIDSVTGDPYCPTTEHYNSNNRMFNIIGEYVGTSTEGIYLAIKEPESYVAADGSIQAAPDDFLLIREGILKQIWFYISNGMRITPDASAIKNRTLKFHWPYDLDHPLIKQSNQRTYTVVHPNNLNMDSQNEIPTSYIPNDKRFGCIPAIL